MTILIDEFMNSLQRDLGFYLLLEEINYSWHILTDNEIMTYANKREFFEVKLREFYHNISLGENNENSRYC